MPKIAYITKNLREIALHQIDLANEIIEEYQALDMTLTLRQVYYQMVARDLFPDDRRWRWTGTRWIRDPKGTKNAEPNYKWFQGLLDDGRMTGRVDWSAIEDRTRFMRAQSHFDSPEDVIKAAAHQFRIDKWKEQDHHVEVFIEKDALVGVIEAICRKLDVTYASCRGYMSQSMMWETGQRLKFYATHYQKQITIVHLGDHDPSGVHMSKDIEDRLSLFMGAKAAKKLTFNRIALNWDQIQQYDPPPSPAKLTDSRAKGYIEEFNTEDSWELDALDPKTIADLISDAVTEVRDEDKWAESVEHEKGERKKLRAISENYEPVSEYVEAEGFIDNVEDEDEE